MPHGRYKAVYRTSIFEVSNQIDVQIFKRTLCLLYGIKVKHGLAGVLVGAVSGVYYGYGSYFACILCRTFQIVAHHDDICIIGNHHDGVFQRFAFGSTGNFGVGKSDNPCTEPVCCSLKTEASSGTGLEE